MAAVVPTQSRSGTETPREAASAARLALAELLLFSEEPVECARATVDWLAERIGARKAVCALIDAGSGTVQHVAASGVPEGQIETLHLAMENPEHPLVFALAGREAVMLGKEGRRNAADPWRGGLLAPPPPPPAEQGGPAGPFFVGPPPRAAGAEGGGRAP